MFSDKPFVFQRQSFEGKGAGNVLRFSTAYWGGG